MRKKLLYVFLLVAIQLIVDQFMKIYIKTSFEPGQTRALFGNWFVLHYIENPGMAFGTTFGSGIWHKLALSIFRLIAIGFIVYYLVKQAKKGASLEFLLVFGLILAGATGNLIDSMFYDYFFTLNPCDSFNQLPGSGIKGVCTDYGFNYPVELRHRGFMLGSVVDMFQFNVNWPKWVPRVGGEQVFPAIWNIADASISTGVILILVRQKAFFPKKKESKVSED
ncbi:MAG: signal peptidase II [Flavobacteriia bacterium]